MGDLPVARVVRGAGPASAPVLTAPPRRVPRRLLIHLLVGGKLGAFGWFVAAFGMAVSCAFVPNIAWPRGTYDARADATIVSVTRAGAEEGDHEVYRVDYVFTDTRAAAHAGTSYTTDPGTSSTRPVEYDADEPSSSRLVGARTNMFPMWTALVLVFPIIGIYMALHRLRRGRREVHLLRHGIETRGRLVEKHDTEITVDDVPMVELTFEYTTQHGATARATVDTLTPEVLEDDATEAMLYDPSDVHVATTLDQLPGRPIVRAGEIVASPGFSMYLLLAPIATAMFLGWMLMRMAA